MNGLFITFEGIEGCGKTTQIKLFAKYLEKQGKSILLTREPGGTEIGDKIRLILLNPDHTAISPLTELLLYGAARAQHVEEVINPALKKEMVVLSDRYADATTAYQGAARKLDEQKLKELHHVATGNLLPKITFLLDLPAEKGLGRARARNLELNKEDRFENEEIEFHKRVRQGYLNIAKDNPERVIIIDATKEIEKINKAIINAYNNLKQVTDN